MHTYIHTYIHIHKQGDTVSEWSNSTDHVMAAVLHTADLAAQAKPLPIAQFWCVHACSHVHIRMQSRAYIHAVLCWPVVLFSR